MSDGVDETQIGPLGNYIESFQEIKLDIANNTAEFGSIGQVTMISKSGTNQLKGNIFDYYSTPWFRARNPFALARGTGVSHNPRRQRRRARVYSETLQRQGQDVFLLLL
jgi:hypothetical protein